MVCSVVNTCSIVIVESTVSSFLVTISVNDNPHVEDLTVRRSLPDTTRHIFLVPNEGGFKTLVAMHT